MANYRPLYLQSLHCPGNGDSATSDPSFIVHRLLSQISEQEAHGGAIHQVYSQLDCLQSVVCDDTGSREQVWRERFRWIKYEEELEAVGNRWSKPHVPILSPFSLMEARRQLDAGIVDLQPTSAETSEEQCSLKQVSQQLRQQLVDSGLDPQVSDEIQRLLLRPRCRFTDNMQRVLAAASENTAEHEAGCETVRFNKKYRKKVQKSAEACEIMVGRSEVVKDTVSAFVRLSQPLADPILEINLPTRFLFIVIASPLVKEDEVVSIGRSIATMMTDQIFQEVAYLAEDKAALLAGVDEFLKSASILPPIGCCKSDRIPPPLKPPNMEHRQTTNPVVLEFSHDVPGLDWSWRPFAGLINDVKRRWPSYKSDFTDALHPQTIGAYFFIYFACITPIITFGGLLSDATHGYLGAIESIVSGLICGVSFALFSGQPLTILGSTGPVLVFETIVFKKCDYFDWDYLSFRWWVGMWTGIILIAAVAFNLSFLVKYITRFTEESFALLIAVIFIFEAFGKVLKIGSEYPVNWNWNPLLESNRSCDPSFDAELETTTVVSSNQTLVNPPATDRYVPDVFLFSCLLFIFTYVISSKLKTIKTASIFPAIVRSVLSDFAVMIAVVAMTVLDIVAGLGTPKLQIPTKFEPTLGFEKRGWIVPPFGKNPWYTSLIALGPALLAVILVFLDQQITAVIVNRRENKLLKGVGYHQDLLVVALCIMINSSLGIPWFVAATVLSINHVISLKKETECAAPGEKPTFLGCRENRVTGFLVFLTIGLSVFLTSVLQYIPMPVLYGVFLFMGVSSLNGLELFQRMILFIQPEKYQPDFKFLRMVKTRRVHFFTMIQIACFAALWAVKKIEITSILFPLMVLSMCFVRKLLDFVFTRDELRFLDDLFPGQAKQERIESRRASRVSNSRDRAPKDEETALCDEKENA